jgi:hypothetical protein
MPQPFEDELPQDGEEEVMDLPDVTTEIEDTEDGGAIVTFGDEPVEDAEDEDFYANLAESMSDSERSNLSTQFKDLISKDLDARALRDKQYAEGIKRTGLGDEAPGGASFSGASRVVHPMMTEVCVDFASRSMKELCPPGGPAKDFIPGESNAAKVKKAERKTKLMNWQLMVQSPTFRPELEQTLTQVPLAGAQYLKVSWNKDRNRPNFEFVPIDDMILPYSATSYYGAERKTHRQYVTEIDFRARVRSKMYRDVDLSVASSLPEQSQAAAANNRIEGKDASGTNDDGLRVIYEIMAICDIGDGDAPYILSIDDISGELLAVYRNWAEDDPSREEMDWSVEFPFVPWRGPYPIGITHMIGGLSGAATGAMRALLDAALIQNSQTMLKLKGPIGGQTLNIQPTEIVEVDGGAIGDDIRKMAMPLPYNQPSGVLFQLLGFLIDTGKGVVRTTMDDVHEGASNAPVGTTLAKIEQGTVVFSAIHARLHASMARVLRILHRLNGMYLDDKMVVEELGEEIATRADFEGPMDVVPVSDPNIWSETQRFAQAQALAQRAAAMPQLYDPYKVEEAILATIKLPNAKDYLAPKATPSEENAVMENVKASLGRPIVAFPEQDHLAHLQTHLPFMVNPFLGASQLLAPKFTPGMIQHIAEHIAFWYASAVYDAVDEHFPGDLREVMDQIKGREDKQEFDRMLAEASINVTMQAGEVFADIPPIVAQAMQVLQQLQQPPPPDPATAAAMADTQAKVQIAQGKMELEKANMAAEQQQFAAEQAALQAELQAKQQLEVLRQQSEDNRTAAEIQARLDMNNADNMTAKELAVAESLTGEKFRVSTGTGVNPGPR